MYPAAFATYLIGLGLDAEEARPARPMGAR
jgi:hypothetical protein